MKIKKERVRKKSCFGQLIWWLLEKILQGQVNGKLLEWLIVMINLANKIAWKSRDKYFTYKNFLIEFWKSDPAGWSESKILVCMA